MNILTVFNLNSDLGLKLAQFLFKKTLDHICLATLLLFAGLGCSEDCSVCPESEPGPVSDYNIYIGLFGGSGGIYIYNTKSMSVVDSILGVPKHNSIAVTAGKEYLIGTNLSGGGGTWIMDLITREVVRQFPYSGAVEVSNDRKYIAIDAEPLRILNAKTFEEVFLDSTVITGGHFDESGEIYYAIKSGNTIVRYDINGDSTLPDILWNDPVWPGGAVRKVIPTSDVNKLFLWVLFGTNFSRVYAYYVNNDSNRIIYNLQSENSDVVLSPDESRLIITDPSNFINTASMNVYIADAINDHVISIVPPPFIANPWHQSLLNSSEIAITPDGKFCVFGAGGSQWQGVMSVKDREYINWFQLDTSGSGGYGRSVTCRKTL